VRPALPRGNCDKDMAKSGTHGRRSPERTRVYPGISNPGRRSALLLRLRRALRRRLGIADGFGEHLAKLGLRLRWLPGGFLPLGHVEHVGMLKRNLKPRIGTTADGSCPLSRRSTDSLGPGTMSKSANSSLMQRSRSPPGLPGLAQAVRSHRATHRATWPMLLGPRRRWRHTAMQWGE
jgi:hypothetical protein